MLRTEYGEVREAVLRRESAVPDCDSAVLFARYAQKHGLNRNSIQPSACRASATIWSWLHGTTRTPAIHCCQLALAAHVQGLQCLKLPKPGELCTALSLTDAAAPEAPTNQCRCAVCALPVLSPRGCRATIMIFLHALHEVHCAAHNDTGPLQSKPLAATVAGDVDQRSENPRDLHRLSPS